MPKFKDITGQKYGRLTVVERVYPPNRKRAWWRCVCDCGNEKITSSDMLKRGGVRSCGCMARDNHPIKHGYAVRKGRQRLYRTWSGIIQRASNPNDKYYRMYGGRGIYVCDEWREFDKFKEWALANGYKDDLFIDRIDNNKGYFPDNCRWVTRFQQQNNLRCNIRYEFADGKLMTNSEIARLMSVSKDRVNRTIERFVVSKLEINEKSKQPHLFILSCTANDLAELEVNT